jgi:microcystin-dependent protein
VSGVLDADVGEIRAAAIRAEHALQGISAGQDVLVSNFDGLKDFVESVGEFLGRVGGGGFFCPTGGIVSFGGVVAPDGWLLCDGGEFDTTGPYAGLFGVIGYAYGGGGAKFRVPDLRGRVAFGKGEASVVDSLGKADAGVVAERSPKHKHSVGSLAAAGGRHGHTGGTHGAGAHSHSIDATREVIGRGTGTSTFGKLDNGGSQGTSGVGDHAHGVYINDGGEHSHSFSGTVGAGAGEVDVVPFVVTNYIIKV